MNNSLVTIITPNFNGQKYIIDTIKSVQAQSYSNWEMLIVDDNSSDKSIDIIENYIKEDNRIKLLKNTTNQGAAISRNKAIEIANGRFIAFLDGDDLWSPNKLEVQINFMVDNLYPFTYTEYEQITEDGEFIKNVNKLPNRVDYLSTIKSNKIGCLTAIYDTIYFGKVYMENIAKRQDYTLWLKLLKKYDYAFCIHQNLASYRIRKNSISSNKFKLIKYHWYIYYRIENHSFIKSLYFIINYILIRVFKSN